MKFPVLSVALVVGTLNAAAAQNATVDHLTPAQMDEVASSLRAKAASDTGSAATKLNDYGTDYTMLSVRIKSGLAEVHMEEADFFFILHGHATLLSGGEVVDPTTSRPGEIKGASLKNANRVSLNPGDVVHIPPGVPHQLLLEGNNSIEYFVIKVKEAPAAAK